MRPVSFSLRSRRRSRSRTPPPCCCAATRPFNRIGAARRLRRRAPQRLRRSCLFAADADADMGGADDRKGVGVPFDESGRVAARSPCPAARCAHRRVLLAPAIAFANAALLALRPVPSAQPPRRLPLGSGPGTDFPFGCLRNLLYFYGLAVALSHPTHLRCPVRPVCAAVRRNAQDIPSTTISTDTNRQAYLGPSVYGFHIHFILLIYKEKRTSVFHRESF